MLFREDLFWRQRAKLYWAKESDSNYMFFFPPQDKSNGRRKKNFIGKLEMSSGTVVDDENLIEQEVISYFENVYSSKQDLRRGD